MFADPRLTAQSETDALLALFGPATVTLPGHERAELPRPDPDRTPCSAQPRARRRSCSRWASASSARATRTCIGSSRGNDAGRRSSAPELSCRTAPWFLAPALRGPFDAPATPGTATVGMLVHTTAFDRDADLDRPATSGGSPIDDDAPDYTPLLLAPGQSGTITVTFTPQGKRGSKVDGTLRRRLQPALRSRATSRSRSRTATRSSSAVLARAVPSGAARALRVRRERARPSSPP